MSWLTAKNVDVPVNIGYFKLICPSCHDLMTREVACQASVLGFNDSLFELFYLRFKVMGTCWVSAHTEGIKTRARTGPRSVALFLKF